MRPLLILTLALLLTACASDDKEKLTGAVSTPLNDLNIVNAPIPETLVRAQQGPYTVPSDASCAFLNDEIRALDEELGPDFDAPATDSNPSIMERGSKLAIGAVRKTAEGVVPFRGWVRKLSGAERYSKQVAAAIAAGTARRAYIKGISHTKNCQS